MSQEVDQIKERLNIAEVIGEYVQLKQAGNHHKGLCPFHQEKTPSFVVSPDKGIWHCFGCSLGGDVFSFIQQKEGVEFPDALKLLAERAGVDLPKQQNIGSRDQRVRLFELMGHAANFYHEVLKNHQAGQQARNYLQERGVADGSLTTFKIGYAPQQWNTIQKALHNKGFTPAELVQVGLIGRSEKGTYYDRFRGRIMFPIHDLQGRVIAFGGRIAPWHQTGNEGKYVNSPETPLYEKRRVVYNLNRAKKELKAHDPLIVVEGYLDVVLLTQHGFANVVAASGTAFTPQHAALLKRYTSILNMAFDADSAGLKAAQAATEEALATGFKVGAYLFPPGKDPADVALRDPAELKKILFEPRPLIQILLDRLKTAQGSVDKDVAWRELIPFVATVQDLVQQGEMIQAIAESLHIPEQRVVEQVATVKVTARSTEPEEDNLGSDSSHSSQEVLIGLCIAFPTVRSDIFERLSDDNFLDQTLASLYTHIVRLADTIADFDRLSASALIDALPLELQTQATALLHIAEEYQQLTSVSERAEVLALIRAIRIEWIQQRLRALQSELAQGEAPDDRTQSLQELQKLAEELSSLRAGELVSPTLLSSSYGGQDSDMMSK